MIAGTFVNYLPMYAERWTWSPTTTGSKTSGAYVGAQTQHALILVV